MRHRAPNHPFTNLSPQCAHSPTCTIDSLRRHDFAAPAKVIAAGLAALLISSDSPAFAATAPTAAASQGELLEKLLQEQKQGTVAAKTIKAAPKPAAPAAYAGGKSSSAKPAARASAGPKKDAKKTEKTSGTASVKKTETKTLKFDTKASSGVQGAAPAGLELPVPKGAVQKAAPVVAAAKKAVAAPKPKPAAPAPVVAAKKVVAAPKPKPAAPAPVVAAKKVEAPKPKPAAPVVAAKKVEAPKPKAAAPAAAPAAKKAAGTAPAAPAFDDAAIQAGAVLAAEVIGVGIASSIVGGLTKKPSAKTA